ncbi:MAG: high frequency lysogenization protein HflD [Gammaproteobacteria bacterium]
MKSGNRERTIALAGMFQAVNLVLQTARGETRNPDDTSTCIGSIFNTDPDTAIAVYGNPANLYTGLDLLGKQLENNRQRNMEMTRHVITLIHLEHKLGRKQALLDLIGAGIDKARGQLEFFDMMHSSVIAALAEVYKQSVSTLQPRILVSGDPVILDNPENKNMIRALLLAAMRAAVLWRQCGGNRFRLIFQRKPLLECSRTLLEEIRGGR